MIPKKKRGENGDSFWISATDMMAGILAVVLLLLMLLVLYIILSNHGEFTSDHHVEAVYDRATPDETDNDHDDDDDNDDYHRNENGGGGGGHTEPTQTETTVSSDDGEEHGRDKTAVFVTVVDADTGNTIKKAGTEFELYADKNGIGGLQTLHTYYPQKIEYKQYETTSQGTFYLPEKITRGWYSLHNIVPPEGYYIDENTDFEIDDYWDWPEPYMVEVQMKPIKSVIRVQVNDGETTGPVENVVYNVIASEDIVTVDGTVRFKKDEIVDEITTNEKGYAESKELYIGNYTIKQIKAPEYYALNRDNYSATIYNEMEKNTGIVSVTCNKTKFILNLTDERTEQPIEGVVYSMEGRDDLTTDENGEFEVIDLEKEVKYTLTVSSLPEGYIKKDTEIVFTVDNSGLIDNSAAYVCYDTAYMICLSVRIEDLVFGRGASGKDMILVDEDGNTVDEWTSGDDGHIISGLKQGVYFVRKPNSEENLASVDLKDTAKLQNVTVKQWDTIDLFAILIGAGIVALAVIAVGILRRKKAGKKRERES
ncbi:MAG: hypothetical protein IJG87_11075 [Ruminococcus sp.]|nr:hypothetical protein [Ruminococcus sp.]